MSYPQKGDVYRFYDSDGRLLYIGKSLSAVQRASQHRSTKEWWADVANMSVTHYETYDEAGEAEIDAIQREGPLYNVVGNISPGSANPWVDLTDRKRIARRPSGDNPWAGMGDWAHHARKLLRLLETSHGWNQSRVVEALRQATSDAIALYDDLEDVVLWRRRPLVVEDEKLNEQLQAMADLADFLAECDHAYLRQQDES